MVVHCAEHLRRRLRNAGQVSGLVVGCGSGDEVVYLRRTFQSSRVFGVDIEANFSAPARGEQCVLAGDAIRLPFSSARYDFVASFHSLEHVGDAQKALNEIQRVLQPGGWFYVGVPNRLRILGYVGSFDATAWQKIVWNLADWRDRLCGRFENQRGAHAGFSRKELEALLAQRFANIDFLTADFVRFKYGGRVPQMALDFLLKPSVLEYAAPSVYALCQSRRTDYS
jgi:SAM-dependent methyltransferase